MTIDFENQALPIFDKITKNFSLLRGLYDARKYSNVDAIIDTLLKNIILFAKVDGNLVTELIRGLNDIRDEDLRGLDSNPENFQLYLVLVQEDLNKLKDLVGEKYKSDKIALPQLVIGKVDKMYGRIMSWSEYNELRNTKTLRARSRPYTVIPVFEAPPKIIDFFMNVITRDKAHNLIQALGGGGNAHIIVIFKTKYVPLIENIPCRHLSQLREAKMGTGTKIEILLTRNI